MEADEKRDPGDSGLLEDKADSISLHAESQKGLFRGSLKGFGQKTAFNTIISWHLQLTEKSGTPVKEAQIGVSGAVASQSHSLPTIPRVSKKDNNGAFLIEGIKFDRQGDWLLKLAVQTPRAQDQIIFEIPVDVQVWADWHDGWTEDERIILDSLRISTLSNPPPDPSNQYSDNELAADFGHRLFFDRRLSGDGSIACANCHIPSLAFTDGQPLARGLGPSKRNTPTIIGSAYSPWLFWDGRKDSLWSQALGPLENPLEHGSSRSEIIAVLLEDQDYRRRYQDLFGALPEPENQEEITRAFVNLGKALAAYERTILPAPAKFDRYVEAILNNRTPPPEDQLSMEEIAGLKVFISENQGQCIRCHNGPMFTDHHFHNIGSHLLGENESEQGRASGVLAALSDESNCQSRFSDVSGKHSPGPGEAFCAELRFAKHEGKELIGAFKTPTLRFLSKTAPYMHAGQFQTLEDVIWQYRDVPPSAIGKTELQRLNMSGAEFAQIEDFLKTLDGPIRAPEKYLRAPQ
ncbi:MAG: hypothetical protein HQM13_18680 [SAR324 cluster bacterium]|nr:hypothetical protein [SAR324 cluster bacterium]